MTDYYGTTGDDRIDFKDLGNDDIYGDTGDDTIYGWFGNDIIYGEEDNDRLYGEGDNDTLIGNTGNDSLYGGRGDDFLNGEEGDDFLKGGGGADAFFFDYPEDGIDTIRDFSYEQGDKIYVSAPGFDIGAGDYDLFEYDRGSGRLYFDDQHFATLDLEPTFSPRADIIIF